MGLTIESFSTKQKILIVDRHLTNLSKLLKETLQKYDNDIYLSPRPAHDLDKFEYSFFINESKSLLDKAIFQENGKYIFLFLNQIHKAEEYASIIQKHKKHNVKVIICEADYLSESDLEKIFWFAFTPNKENLLHLHTHTKTHHPKRQVERQPFRFRKSHLKFIVTTGFVITLIGHLLFIPHLLFGSWQLFQAGKALQSQQLEKVSMLVSGAENNLTISSGLYSFSRPTLLFFSLASFTDNLFEMDKLTMQSINKSLELYTRGKKYANLVLKKNKTVEEQEALFQEQKQITSLIQSLQRDLGFLKEKIPNWHPTLVKTKNELTTISSTLETGAKLIPYADKLLAKNTTKRYLLLFANNMELRPGGGFIGSFAIVTARDYGIDTIQVYDVYDADGQLKAHIEPPAAIKNYLNQPHWFLRDSAFSPDFYENYQSAKMFLTKEMNLSSFDGAILVTTTSIQNIIAAIGDIYIPDFKEIVNKDNFYLKAQYYAEHDFFPGSTQKKRFLGAVLNQLFIALEEASPIKLLDEVTKSLNEKQIVLYFDDKDIQSIFDQQYWTGKMFQPTCTSQEKNCIVDYLMPVEANVGVNKANFFINRAITLRVNIDSKGKINHRYIMQLKNDSSKDAFPGGVYRNYMQVYLPTNATVKQITKNGVLVEKYYTNQILHTSVGFLVEIQPQASSEIVIDYELNKSLTKGKGVYQLIVQKQIGSGNYDFSFSLSLPSNVYTVNQNFSPLVKENKIDYNTSIKTDKIFFVELLKE